MITAVTYVVYSEEQIDGLGDFLATKEVAVMETQDLLLGGKEASERGYPILYYVRNRKEADFTVTDLSVLGVELFLRAWIVLPKGGLCLVLCDQAIVSSPRVQAVVSALLK